MKVSSRVSISENSRNGAARSLCTARTTLPRRKPRLKEVMDLPRSLGAGDGIAGREARCPGPLASLLGLGSFPASQFAPASASRSSFPSSPTILSPSTLVAEAISQCPAKGIILIVCDLSNKTLAGRASRVQRAGDIGAWLQTDTCINLTDFLK